MSFGLEVPQRASNGFAEAVAIMARLRAADGCPWDREQTFDSIRQYTLEETYEVFDAIERRHWPDLEEELGDLLLQVLFYSQMAAEAGHFTIDGVIESLNRKLVRRHPHVFGDEAAAAAGNAAQGLETGPISATQVLRNWREIKGLEKQAKAEHEGLLEAIPRSFPALLEARKLGAKAAEVGFDWPDAGGLLAKVREETAELEHEMSSAADGDALAGELGDLLFTVVNLARHLKVDPEFALRETNAKFRSRFGFMEDAAARPLNQHTPEELEALWTQSKQQEKQPR